MPDEEPCPLCGGEVVLVKCKYTCTNCPYLITCGET